MDAHPPTLPKKDQDRIYAEEFFRRKAQIDLEKADTWGWLVHPRTKFVIKLLHSPFIISVLLGLLVPWAYAKWDQSLQQEASSRRVRERIAIEIDHRIETALHRFEEYGRKVEQARSVLNAEVREAAPRFPEFNGNSLSSLGYEYAVNLSSNEKKDAFIQVIDHVEASGSSCIEKELDRLRGLIAADLPGSAKRGNPK
ncbi:MAG: hypothetical protein ACYTGL_02720 [Planctomycetota bacterium]|jgi:hypothetical protein